MIGTELAGDPSVSRWLAAADARRRAARAAFVRAATARPRLARRYQRQADIDLASATCHEWAAQAAFNVALVTEDAAHARILQGRDD